MFIDREQRKTRHSFRSAMSLYGVVALKFGMREIPGFEVFAGRTSHS